MRRKISIALLSFTVFVGWIDPATDKNEEGRQHYDEGEYGEAISKFTDAQLHLPESDSLNFNIANTHYKVGKLPEAEKSYKGILDSKDVTLKAKANYNMGNTMYKQGKFNEALDFYKKAIKLTEKKSDVNGDEIKGVREDAKYNYEFVQKKMEEMKEEQQEREEKEEQEKQEKQEQEKQDDQKQGEEQKEKQEEENPDQQQEKEQEEQDKSNKGKQENEPPPENEKSPSQPYEKKEMTKEEAERILDALRQSERSARDMQEKEEESAPFMIEKNW